MIAAILLNGLLDGAAIVAVAYAAVHCVSERSAATRYALWFAALLALAFVPILAVVSNEGARLVDALRPHAGGSAMIVSLLPVGALAHNAAQFAAPAVTWIVAIWLLGTFIQGSRLVVSFVRIERIRKGATPLDVGGGSVLVSNDVTMPIAAGLFAPVVIIPKSVIDVLAPNDLEHVIAHERAHILRNDVTGNLIQRSIEAILFFNPWVYVIGRNLINERESACDDLAVERTGLASDYAECLAALAQRLNSRRTSLLTPSALGSRNAVIARIRRLLRNGATGATSLNYYSIGGTIVVFAVLTLALQAVTSASAAPVDASAALSVNRPAAVVAAACTVPNAEAKVVTANPPDIPRSAAPLRGFVNILVTIAPSGKISNAAVQHSSGNSQVDKAVLNAAKTSTYAPARKNCEPVAGNYLFHAEFAP